AWNEGALVRCPVGIRKWGELNLRRLTDHAAEHHRNSIACRDVTEATPGPLAIPVHNLDAMRRGALDPVAATRFHGDDRLRAIHEELGRLPRPLVCRNFSVKSLPFGAVHIAKPLKPDQSAI